MKFDTLKRDPGIPSNPGELIFIGLLTLGAGWALKVFITYVSVPRILTAGVFLAKVLVGVPLLWLLGHAVVKTVCSPEKCGCSYTYRYFWTEWLHKKYCLSYVLNK